MILDLPPGYIQGTAVDYKGTAYTLNFDQQNQLLEELFHADKKERVASSDVRYIIYCFDRPTVFIEDEEVEFQDPGFRELFLKRVTDAERSTN